jgi:hypothetical protein
VSGRLVLVGVTMLVAACSTLSCAQTRPQHAAAATPTASAPPPSSATPVSLPYRYLTDLHSGTQAKRYGFNLVDLGPYRSLIDALPAGERALVWLGGYSRAACAFVTTDAGVRGEVSALARDPKVAGYYIDDEADDALPANGGHCPHVVAQIEARDRLVRLLAPGTFTYEVVAEPRDFAAFGPLTDVLGAVAYPCLVGRQCDWSKIPRYIADLEAAHVARYWGVLQAFGYGKWRAPTPTELRTMISQWQASRWQGEQVFAWDWAGWSLASDPGLLAVLGAANCGWTLLRAASIARSVALQRHGLRNRGRSRAPAAARGLCPGW